MASPITPQMMDCTGKIVTMVCEFTSTGATKRDTFDLPTYAPKIDLRRAHPVLSLWHISSTALSAGSQHYLPSNEMARGTVADSSNEWDISDMDTIGIYHEANESGFVVVTYFAYGEQKA